VVSFFYRAILVYLFERTDVYILSVCLVKFLPACPLSHKLDATTTPSTNDSKNARCTLALTPHSLSADGVLCYDYAVYALRSQLPAPLDLWSASHATRATHLRRTKAEASASVVGIREYTFFGFLSSFSSVPPFDF
jgi:hypothetical protein